MKRKTLLIIISGIVAFVLLVLLLIPVALEPWAEKKIQSKFNEKVVDYLLDIGKVKISILRSRIELNNTIVRSKQENEGVPVLKAEISSFELKGIKLVKAIFKKDIDISEVIIFNSHITGIIPVPEKSAVVKISPLNIRIGRFIFDQVFLDIKSDSSAQAYLIRNGFLNVHNLEVEKFDTLSAAVIKQFDFNAQEFITVSADSLYTIAASELNYSETSNTLSVINFTIQPNYPDYEFSDRHQFESDRVEAKFSDVSFNDFSVEDYIKSGNLISSSIVIGELNMKIFRDKRKEFRHVNRPTLQEVIYNYPGKIDIDSLGILNGSIIYKEHAEKANEPGMIWFDGLKAWIYKISNDTVYKTEEAYLEIKAEALLMGKGKANVFLKGRIFDSQNTFAVNGTLSEMEAMEINPILEKNAFIYATSGEIENMNFSFTANNSRATGNMRMLYHGLNLTIKNKLTDDTTAVKEQIISFIANIKVMDSNPKPGEEVRMGIIDYDRDPEKFLFNYIVKAIMSGIISSISRNQEKNK